MYAVKYIPETRSFAVIGDLVIGGRSRDRVGMARDIQLAKIRAARKTKKYDVDGSAKSDYYKYRTAVDTRRSDNEVNAMKALNQ